MTATEMSASVPASVSVIIPAYNAAPYLDAALGSVAGQRHRADEVVVVDDASTDDTSQIAARWADRLPITLVRKPVNEGLGAARRTAIEASSGALLALLDSDDVWLPDHLEAMLAAFTRQPGIITSGNYRWWPGRRVDPRPSWDVNRVPPLEQQRTEILRRNFLFVATLFARADYDAVGGFSTRRISEDWELWLRMIRQGGLAVTTPNTVTVLYRQREDSLSSLDGTLDADLDVLGELGELTPEEQRIVATTIRQIEARQDLLAGYERARSGDLAAARRLWIGAALHDRSVRLGRGRNGSTTLRALAFLASPQRALAARDQRVR